MSEATYEAPPPFTMFIGLFVVATLSFVMLLVKKRTRRSEQVAAAVPVQSMNADGIIAGQLAVAGLRIRSADMADPERAEEHALQLAVEASLSHRSNETSDRNADQQQQQAEHEEQETLERSIQARVLEFPTISWGVKHTGDEECALCMDSFAQDDVLRVLHCQHYFHAACIDRWLLRGSMGRKTRSCPLCQKSIFKTSEGADAEGVEASAQRTSLSAA